MFDFGFRWPNFGSNQWVIPLEQMKVSDEISRLKKVIAAKDEFISELLPMLDRENERPDNLNIHIDKAHEIALKARNINASNIEEK